LMRLGIDYRPAQKRNSRRRGLGRYTVELTRALLSAGGEDRETTLFSLPGEPLPAEGNFKTREVPYLKKPSRLNWLRDRIFLPGQVSAEGLDVFQATEINAIPAGAGCRVSAVVHDLIPYIFWEETRKTVPFDFLWALKSARKQIPGADVIIADSEHTRKDICRMLEVDEGKVEVVYLGKSDSLELVPRKQAREELDAGGHISEPFLFYVGGSDYRKNMHGLLRFFARIRKRGYEGKLVLGGETFLWDIPEIKDIRQRAERLGLENHLIFPGYLPDRLLARYYAAADFFVFPSLYEGFGLPVLEAMQCGAPLLLSHASSIPEVAGENAFYFDPASPESMEHAFDRAMDSPDKVRAHVKKGLERAEEFTWEAAAGRLMDIYHRMVN